jgi:Tol biopolymer transport system component
LRRLSETEGAAPAYSRDGRLVAFLGQGTSCRSRKFPPPLCPLYVMNADGGTPRQVAWTTSEPSWAPHGRLAFHTGRWIASVRSDGGGVQRVRGTGRYDSQPAWSPGGRFILFVRTRGPAPPEIRRVRAQGGPTTVLRRQATAPTWAPDGRTIVYIDQSHFDSEVWTMRSDGKRARRLTRSGILADLAPTFSPDGRWIAFVRYGYTWPPPLQRLLVMPTSGGRPRTVIGLWQLESVSTAWRPTPRAR